MSNERDVETRGRAFWSGYDLLWGLTEPPARRTALDRDQIVTAAVELADADGLGAVTMRRVAERLGTAPMSLYRHVPDKDALLSVMVDRVIAAQTLRFEEGDLPDGWRDGLRLVARGTWAVASAHPWYPEASMVRPPLTPSGVAGLELALSLFDPFDLAIGTKMLFVGSVHFSVLSAALGREIERQSMARMDLSEEEVFLTSVPFVQRMIESGRYPRVAAFIVDADHTDDETQMWAGVELLLDGIETRLGRGGA